MRQGQPGRGIRSGLLFCRGCQNLQLRGALQGWHGALQAIHMPVFQNHWCLPLLPGKYKSTLTANYPPPKRACSAAWASGRGGAAAGGAAVGGSSGASRPEGVCPPRCAVGPLLPMPGESEACGGCGMSGCGMGVLMRAGAAAKQSTPYGVV